MCIRDSPLAALLESGSKYLAFTENQRELLELFASGLSDAAVAKRLGVTASTVRHQRFTFREKCKTARMTLAVLELDVYKRQGDNRFHS